MDSHGPTVELSCEAQAIERLVQRGSDGHPGRGDLAAFPACRLERRWPASGCRRLRRVRGGLARPGIYARTWRGWRSSTRASASIAARIARRICQARPVSTDLLLPGLGLPVMDRRWKPGQSDLLPPQRRHLEFMPGAFVLGHRGQHAGIKYRGTWPATSHRCRPPR